MGSKNTSNSSTPIRHGSRSGYDRGCRCAACKECYSAAQKRHYLRHREELKAAAREHYRKHAATITAAKRAKYVKKRIARLGEGYQFRWQFAAGAARYLPVDRCGERGCIWPASEAGLCAYHAKAGEMRESLTGDAIGWKDLHGEFAALSVASLQMLKNQARRA